MSEPSLNVTARDGLQGSEQSLQQGIEGARRQGAQGGLDFGAAQLDRIEVGRIWPGDRQVDAGQA